MVAARFGISVSSAVQYSQRYRRVSRGKMGGHRRRVLEPYRDSIKGNLGSHKAKVVRTAIRTAGACLWLLPPYSPDLNPIEQAFAKIKHRMRMAQKRNREHSWRQVGQIVGPFAKDECANYFENAGYASIKISRTLIRQRNI